MTASKRLSIVQVSAYYPPHLGGQENAVRDLSTQLASLGHDVCVITSAIGGRYGVSVEEGVRIRRLRGRSVGHAPIMPGLLAALRHEVTPGGIVHLHIGQAFTPEMVWLAAKLWHFPYVAQLHIDFEPSGPLAFLLPIYKRLVLRRVLHGAAGIMALNQRMQTIVRDSYDFQRPVHVISNAVDDMFFELKRPALATQPPRRLRLLCVGRLEHQKNITMLVKAIAASSRDVSLDIIGDGPFRQAVADVVRRHNLAHVTLHGRLPRERVAEFYRQCDALIMPSLYESQPMVLLEALAAKVPIIGTNVIGIAEHIKDAGIIVEPTIDGIAGGFDQFYTAYDRLPQMVDRGYESVEKLRGTNIAKEYQDLYATRQSA